MNRLTTAATNMDFVRAHTLRLIEDIPDDEWFRMPGEVTHVAWQVGHLAMAEYRLLLFRMRGLKPEDAELISDHFISLFGQKSVPDADVAKYPSPSEIRAALNRVHAQVMKEYQELPDAILDEPLATPHPICKTKVEMVGWCPAHEGTHTGQIGLLRRLMLHKPIW